MTNKEAIHILQEKVRKIEASPGKTMYLVSHDIRAHKAAIAALQRLEGVEEKPMTEEKAAEAIESILFRLKNMADDNEEGAIRTSIRAYETALAALRETKNMPEKDTSNEQGWLEVLEKDPLCPGSSAYHLECSICGFTWPHVSDKKYFRHCPGCGEFMPNTYQEGPILNKYRCLPNEPEKKFPKYRQPW